MRGLILAGGTGSRLSPLTITTNKHMLPVYDRPMIDWGIFHLHEIGIQDIGIVISKPHDEQIKSYLGPKYTYIHQGDAQGIGQAVLAAKDFIGNEDFVVHLGDQIYTDSLRKYMEAFYKLNSDIYIILKQSPTANQHTMIFLDNDKIVDIKEKPATPEAGYVMTGMSFYKPTIFSTLLNLKPGHKGEYQLSDAIRDAWNGGRTVDYGILNGDWVDAGTPDNLMEASKIMKAVDKTFSI